MVCSSPALRAQGPSGSGEEERRGGEPDLLWLAELTGADIGLPPIPQDPEDRCSIWENLVSLVDFQSPGFPLTAEELGHYISIPRTSSSSSSWASTTTLSLPRAGAPPPPTGDSDYRSNAHAKPPFSYATLICMAMEASKEPKITLAAICKWISDNFRYFRRADPTWQRSIRHNLCTNKRFVKVPREKGEPGRGAFWKLHPRYAEQLRNSTLRERRRLPEHIPAARQESRRVPSPAARICGSRSRLEVGTELQRLLQEFEEFESGQNGSAAEKGAGQQLPQPRAEPEVSGLDQSELTELKGSADWEDLLNPRPEQGEFPTLGHPELPPPVQPGAFPLHREGRGQQQILPGASPGKPGLDETLMATAFLEAAWPQESGENLPDCAFLEQGAGNTQGSLLEGDAMDWESLSYLKLC